ncbi:flagellar hook-length control protein FliK [Sphingomonas aerolata]|uniref:flagellar hook-length control protein FliK n=1 Tax=Sphingomonas aerolata TaxID=185951 RepID=UPI002FE23150
MTLVVQQPPAAATQPQPGTVASAAQVFGAAIQAAAQRRDEPRLQDDTTLLAPLAAAGTVHALAPTMDVQAPLDMRQERWPAAMIERIDILRDAANATDTRIRLIPDALGTIDVSVRRDGDTVHVHFAAEQAATRSLLQEAQPRLTELADARGLKLSQGSVDTGAGQQQQRTATPHQPSAPARARAGTATAPDTDSTDTRLA